MSDKLREAAQELNTILLDESYDSVQVMPNGEVRAYKSSYGEQENAKPRVFSLEQVLETEENLLYELDQLRIRCKAYLKTSFTDDTCTKSRRRDALKRAFNISMEDKP